MHTHSYALLEPSSPLSELLSISPVVTLREQLLSYPHILFNLALPCKRNYSERSTMASTTEIQQLLKLLSCLVFLYLDLNLVFSELETISLIEAVSPQEINLP